MMKVAVHQPNFLPWLGYFYKIYLCDVFVILDDVQFISNSYINRCYIKTVDNPNFLLNLPLENRSNRSLINELKINFSREYDNILKTVSRNYKKGKNFSFLKEIEYCFEQKIESLVDFNVLLIKKICSFMHIEKPFIYSSSLNIQTNGQERIIDIVKKLGGSTYLSGQGAKQYQDENKFCENGVLIEYLNFNTPIYQQLWGDFQQNLSSLDYVLNNTDIDSVFHDILPSL